MAWHETAWKKSGMKRHEMETWNGMKKKVAWNGMTWNRMKKKVAWNGMTWSGMKKKAAWNGMTWSGMRHEFGMTWSGMNFRMRNMNFWKKWHEKHEFLRKMAWGGMKMPWQHDFLKKMAWAGMNFFKVAWAGMKFFKRWHDFFVIWHETAWIIGAML